MTAGMVIGGELTPHRPCISHSLLHILFPGISSQLAGKDREPAPSYSSCIELEYSTHFTYQCSLFESRHPHFL
jgi:hypothetical protein